MNRSAATALRVVLGGVLLGTVLVQLVVPGVFSELGSGYDETADLVLPYSVVAIAAVVFLQAALVAVDHLAGLVQRGVIFTGPALRWVDAATGCWALGALLAVLPPAHLLVVVGVGGPGIGMLLLIGLVGGVALVVVLRVLRDLLRSAIDARDELAGVI